MAVLDLSQVTFCDSSALNAMLLAHRQAQRTGTQLRLASPGGIVARMLELTGADQVFPVDRRPPLDAEPDSRVA